MGEFVAFVARPADEDVHLFPCNCARNVSESALRVLPTRLPLTAGPSLGLYDTPQSLGFFTDGSLWLLPRQSTRCRDGGFYFHQVLYESADNYGMRWRNPMPKFDWHKEPPLWKLTAWVIMLSPGILLAVAAVVKAFKG